MSANQQSNFQWTFSSTTYSESLFACNGSDDIQPGTSCPASVTYDKMVEGYFVSNEGSLCFQWNLSHTSSFHVRWLYLMCQSHGFFVLLKEMLSKGCWRKMGPKNLTFKASACSQPATFLCPSNRKTIQWPKQAYQLVQAHNRMIIVDGFNENGPQTLKPPLPGNGNIRKDQRFYSIS